VSKEDKHHEDELTEHGTMVRTTDLDVDEPKEKRQVGPIWCYGDRENKERREQKRNKETRKRRRRKTTERNKKGVAIRMDGSMVGRSDGWMGWYGWDGMEGWTPRRRKIEIPIGH